MSPNLLKCLDLLEVCLILLFSLLLEQVPYNQFGQYSLLLYVLDLMVLYNMIFQRSGMSVLLRTNGANKLLILYNMAHALALAISMYLLYMLIKVIFLSERGRAMLALPKFNNCRFFRFLLVWRNIIIILSIVLISLFFLLILL